MELKPYKTVLPIHVSWLNDVERMKYSEQRHYAHSRDSVQRYVDRMYRMWGVWNGPLLVGTVAAQIDKPNDVVDVGILIGDPGQGYGLKAWTLALDALVDHRLITAGCMAGNLAMKKILSKTMQHDHERRGIFILDGKPHDGVYFRKDR